MADLILTRGLPGCGKSTYALEWVAADPENRVRVNRDDLRMEILGQVYPVADKDGSVKEKEARVTVAEHQRIGRALQAGKDVISDNTNLNPRVFSTYGKIAKRYGAQLKNVDFPVSIDECIRRNNARDRVVPESVIRDMARKFMGPNGEFHLFPGSYPVQPFVKPDTKKKAIIFDMDGTLTDVRPIRHLVRGKYRDFDAFHRSSLFCPPNDEVLQMFYDAKKNGYERIIVTARSEQYGEVTQKWLDNYNADFSNIYMRPEGDMRKDNIVKAEILEKILEDYDVVHCVDDNPNVAQTWADAGIRTTVVAGFDDDLFGETERIKIENPFQSGNCLRCGKPFKGAGALGPRCATKV